MKIANLEVEHHSASSYSVACEQGGFRYHIWVDGDRKLAETLYKNPLHGVAISDPAYFRTRKLSPTSDFGGKLIAEMMKGVAADNLFDKADQKAAALAEEERLANAEAARVRRIKEHAVELHKALKSIRDAYHDAEDFRRFFEQVRALMPETELALAQAEGR